MDDLTKQRVVALGETLAAFRTEHGVSRRQVADGTQVSRNVIWRIETGQVAPTWRILMKLLHYYGQTVKFVKQQRPKEIRNPETASQEIEEKEPNSINGGCKEETVQV